MAVTPTPLIPLARARDWARAIGAPDTNGLEALLTNGVTVEDVLWLAKQGIAPYVRHRLRKAGLLNRLAPEAAAQLTLGYSLSAVHEAAQHEGTLTGILSVLDAASVEVVILKGMALAHTVYPSPQLRPKSDIDLWIPGTQATQAVQALMAAGFRLDDDVNVADVVRWQEGELPLTLDRAAACRVELQFPPLRGLWARQCARIDHEAMWRRAVPVVIDGHAARILCTSDALLHVAFHQAINHQFTYPCWLRSLLDVHLLVLNGAPDWELILESARAWRLYTVMWTVLTLAQTLMGSPIPNAVLNGFAPHPARRVWIRRLALEQEILEARPADYRLRRYAVQLAMTDQPLDGARLVARALFPGKAWLRARYPQETEGWLPLRHWRRLIIPGKEAQP